MNPNDSGPKIDIRNLKNVSFSVISVSADDRYGSQKIAIMAVEAFVREPLSVIPRVQGYQQGIPLNLSSAGPHSLHLLHQLGPNERVPCRYEQGTPSRGTGYLHSSRLTLMKADNGERVDPDLPGERVTGQGFYSKAVAPPATTECASFSSSGRTQSSFRSGLRRRSAAL